MGELVVGVDGSDGSRVALARPVEGAWLRGDDLTVVTVAPPPLVPVASGTNASAAGASMWADAARVDQPALRPSRDVTGDDRPADRA